MKPTLTVLTAVLDKLSPELNPLLRQIAWETVSAYPHSGVKGSK